MRLHEIAARSLEGVTETVVVADTAAEATAVDSLLAGLRLAEPPVAIDSPVGECRLVVVPVTDAVAPTAALAGLAAPDARRALVAVAAAPSSLPLGPVVDALAQGGWAVREALAVEHPTWATVVVADRLAEGETLLLHAYLEPGREVPLAGRALLRLLDEHVVEGLVARARLDELQAERDALAAEVAVLREQAVEAGAAVVPASGSSSSGLAGRLRRGARRATGR